jgi:hypothetical protein
VLTADGRLDLPVQGSVGGLLVGGDARLFRSAAGVLATLGTLEAKTVIAHNSLTLSSRTPGVTPPLAGAARLYVKDGKLVIQYNDGLRVLYTTIPMNSGGPYPAIATATTDTTPP